jgi:hypothetical protein
MPSNSYAPQWRDSSTVLAMQAVARRSICAGIVLIAVILKFNHADADVTNNSREFRRVRDLATENWTA